MSSARLLVLQVHSRGFVQVDGIEGIEVLLDWPWLLLPSFVINFSLRTMKITML